MSHRILPLAAENVSFRFGAINLIDGLNFTLDAGPVTMFIGPNGAGKSLTLRLCHGLLKPNAGHIRWRGFDADEPGRHQSFVFQRPALLRRSVMANVEYPLKLRGAPREERRERAHVALERTGLAALASRSARILSGGEQQKLALARAWVTEPEVLFLDEPTSHLDPRSSADVEDLIRAIHASGTKIIMTSHDMPQVGRLGDEVLFLHHGQILERGPAHTIMRSPKTEEAAAFIRGELVL